VNTNWEFSIYRFITFPKYFLTTTVLAVEEEQWWVAFFCGFAIDRTSNATLQVEYRH